MNYVSEQNILVSAGNSVAILGLVLMLILGPMLSATAAEKAHAPGEQDQHKAKEKHEAPGHDEDSGVKLDPKVLKSQGVVVEMLKQKKLPELMHANGEVRYNERNRVALTARSSGWAEEVKVFANQRVKKDQLLAKLYSPEFLSAQHEYMLILDRASRDDTNNADTQSLLTDARQRLKILGLTPDEIETLAQSREPYSHQHVHSPISGVVIEHKLSTGGAVTPGQMLYVVASMRTVWVELALSEMQLGKVRPGQKVTVTANAYPGRQFRGQILSIGAHMDESTRTVKARALIKNSRARLKPGMFANAEIVVGTGRPALSLPQPAVLRSPDGDWVVFVEEEPGHFEPVEIEVVRTVGARVVIKGLKPGTRVVTKGAFFIQSELAKSGFDIHNH